MYGYFHKNLYVEEFGPIIYKKSKNECSDIGLRENIHIFMYAIWL